MGERREGEEGGGGGDKYSSVELGGYGQLFWNGTNFGMLRLVAVLHSMVRNMAPFGGTCVVYLHPYIPNNGKSEQGRCYKVTVPNRVGPNRTSWGWNLWFPSLRGWSVSLWFPLLRGWSLSLWFPLLRGWSLSFWFPLLGGGA